MMYALQIGREPALSLAEVVAVFGVSTSDIKLVDSIPLIEGSMPGTALFGKLGGSIKMSEYMGEMSVSDFQKNSVKEIFYVLSGFEIEDGSGAFALNFFGEGSRTFNKKKRQIGVAVKKELKQTWSHARFVESKEEVTSSVTVKRNKLLRGSDLWIVFNRQKVIFFRTVAVQDYESFAERDYGRPKSDARAGMLPPKLARMMLNIAGVKETSCVYDPFVGTGTVLQEAASLGVGHFIGSDISAKAISDTKQNIEWLSKTIGAPFTTKLFVSDISSVRPSDASEATHVVAELDLGQPLRGHADDSAAQTFAQEAGKLTEAALNRLSELPKVSRIVLAIPFWISHNQRITTTPFAVPHGVHFVPADPAIVSQFPNECSKRGGFLYMRDDQFVGREIITFQKKK